MTLHVLPVHKVHQESLQILFEISRAWSGGHAFIGEGVIVVKTALRVACYIRNEEMD